MSVNCSFMQQMSGAEQKILLAFNGDESNLNESKST